MTHSLCLHPHEVRGLLAKPPTVTLIVRPMPLDKQPGPHEHIEEINGLWYLWYDVEHPWGYVDQKYIALHSPLGVPCDLLIGKETWALCKGTPGYDDSGKETVYYKCYNFYRIIQATGKAQPTMGEPIKWRTPQSMPRELSRITLENIGGTVKQVQAITDEEAILAGIQVIGRPELNELSGGKFIHAFKCQWNADYAKRGLGWDANPYCWLIYVKVLTAGGT